MDMGITTKMGDMETPSVKLPAVQMSMDLEVKEVTQDGVISYEMTMGEAVIAEGADANPQVVEAMKASLANMKGLNGAGKLSSRGLNLGAQVKVAPDATPDVRQAVDQMSDSISRMATPLPEEAVGPGAKWEVRMPIKNQGMTINQVGTVEVISIDGDVVTMKTDLVQSAANQKIQSPDMPQMKLDLTKMTGKGSGETTVDLNQVLAVSGKLNTHSEMNMNMSMGGQKQSMTMTMDMDIRTQPSLTMTAPVAQHTPEITASILLWAALRAPRARG